MATLHDLHRAIFPAATPVGTPALTPERAVREVGWVRVLRPRVPAFDALEPGDLAIIPGPALGVVAPGPAQTEELTAALARARVPAVLLVEGETGADALDALGAAAVTAGLAVLRLPRTDPVALERSVIGFLVNRRAEIDRRAADLEGQLARLALQGRGPEALAAAIGSFLGRPVVFEGRRGDAIAVHAPPEQPAATAAVGAYLANPRGSALRVPIQAPAGEPGLAGRLILLGDLPADEFERITCERIAPLLALELGHDAAVRQAREEATRSDPLPSDGPPWVIIAARQSPGRPDSAGSSSRERLDADDLAARDEVRAQVRMLAPPARLVLRGTSESLELRLVAAASDDDPDGLAMADRIATFLGRTVAVSRPFSEPAARSGAEAATRATLGAAETLETPPRIALEGRLPAYLLLGNLHNVPDGARQARELLAPILVGRSSTQHERLATLRAILDTRSLGEAAARLGVHRNTIAYRVARLEALGGWDLGDPELRFALALAVRLVQDA
jgi:purine catabolism regulator